MDIDTLVGRAGCRSLPPSTARAHGAGACSPNPNSPGHLKFEFRFQLEFRIQIPSAPPQASLASGLVDVCLIPEVRFKLDGDNGLVQHLERLLELKGHAMICVAEGAAQVGF